MDFYLMKYQSKQCRSLSTSDNRQLAEKMNCCQEQIGLLIYEISQELQYFDVKDEKWSENQNDEKSDSSGDHMLGQKNVKIIDELLKQSQPRSIDKRVKTINLNKIEVNEQSKQKIDQIINTKHKNLDPNSPQYQDGLKMVKSRNRLANTKLKIQECQQIDDNTCKVFSDFMSLKDSKIRSNTMHLQNK